eukprot:s1288_g21.t1
MEQFVTDAAEPLAARLFVWWWLCMIFASLRFDDAMHVKPSELTMKEEGLFGVAWQTKVERKRRGTKFAVPMAGFKDSTWLQVGWEIFQLEDFDRDFWIRDLNTREEFRDEPATYQRSLQWIRNLSKHAVNVNFEGKDKVIRETLTQLGKITAHSARRSTEEIGLQANWKNPGPLVLKYTRNRTTIPAQMVHQLVRDLADQEHPLEANEDVIVDGADQSSLTEVQFFVKTTGSRTNQDFRYHCSPVDDPTVIACNRLLMDDCTSVGSFLPDPSVLCKHCAKARPDVAARCFTAE